MTFRRCLAGAAFVCLSLWLSSPGAASAANKALDLDGATKTMAQRISQTLAGLGEEAVSIGQFTSPPQLAASGGAGISKLLADHLTKAGMPVKRRASVGVQGEFRDKLDAQGKPAVEILTELVDRRGEVLLSFPQEVAAAQDVASTLGLTFEAPADKPAKKQAEKIKESIEKPKVELVGTKAKAAPESPYAIEVQVNDGPQGAYIAHPIFEEEGLAFVDIAKGRLYAVHLINDSPHDAAVTLTIDGLNVFAFSENQDYRHFIVPAKSEGTILGWHRDNRVSDAFQITEYSKSAAAELLPDSASLGTITASFAAAWPEDENPPSDEFDARLLGRGSGNATGRGPEVKAGYREVRRHTGRVRASISVRYDK